MITIEFENPIVDKCDCCGEEMVHLTRFVHQDNNAFAVYYAKFTKTHDDKVVYGLISRGGWGEGTGSDDRTAFSFRIWSKDDNYQVGLTDKEESPWSDAEFLGQILDRKEALKHPWLKEVFHITDHIVADDKIIVEYLQ